MEASLARSGLEGRGAWLTAMAANPGAVVAAYIVSHLFVWTLTPYFSHSALPIDVIEGYALGKEWVMGSYKHPALPSWLLQLTRIVTGTTTWPAYFLSAICIAATYAFVFLLGRDLMGAPRAAAGTLLLSGVIYFNWVTPEFNHNVVQMPLWAGFVWALWRATQRDGLGWWLLAAAFAAVSMYAKLSSALLIFAAALWLLLDPPARQRLLAPAPWAALGLFLVLSFPLAYWLVTSDFLSLRYATQRAMDGKAGGAFMFLGKQIASCAVVLLFLLGSELIPLRQSPATPHLGEPTHLESRRLRYLLYFLLAPLVIATLGSLALDAGLKGSWGAPMLNLVGLTAVALCWGHFSVLALKRIMVGAALLMVAVPISYVITTNVVAPYSNDAPRVTWPQEQIAARMQQIWRERTGGQPLRIVAGDIWIAGMIAASMKDPPSLLIETDFDISPWIDRQRLEKQGALVVWWRSPVHPPMAYRWLTGERIDGIEVMNMTHVRHEGPLRIIYTIIPPAID